MLTQSYARSGSGNWGGVRIRRVQQGFQDGSAAGIALENGKSASESSRMETKLFPADAYENVVISRIIQLLNSFRILEH